MEMMARYRGGRIVMPFNETGAWAQPVLLNGELMSVVQASDRLGTTPPIVRNRIDSGRCKRKDIADADLRYPTKEELEQKFKVVFVKDLEDDAEDKNEMNASDESMASKEASEPEPLLESAAPVHVEPEDHDHGPRRESSEHMERAFPMFAKRRAMVGEIYPPNHPKATMDISRAVCVSTEIVAQERKTDPAKPFKGMRFGSGQVVVALPGTDVVMTRMRAQELPLEILTGTDWVYDE